MLPDEIAKGGLPKFALTNSLAPVLLCAVQAIKYVSAVIETAPVPVAPLSGLPLLFQASLFFLKYNLLLSKSTAIPTISPAVVYVEAVYCVLLFFTTAPELD